MHKVSNIKNDQLKFTKRLLLIGPLPNFKLGKMGGARVSFRYLLDFMERNAVQHRVVNTQPAEQGAAKALNPVVVLFLFFKYIGKSDIVFVNMSMGGTTFIAPILFIFSKLLGKKFVFRPFGSRMKEVYENYSSLQKWIFKNTLVRSDIFFLQTKYLQQFFNQLGGHIMHLPTSRDRPHATLVKQKPQYQKRLIFLGHVKESKGIDLLLQAKKVLDQNYLIHIYGPIKEVKYQEVFNSANSIYKGVLKKEEVIPTLAQYDILLLPTHFEGEGYPGVLIEAYSLGIPVITTNWKYLPEIVKHQKTGLLINIKSVEALVEAIQSINEENYPDYSHNAKKYFEQHFNADQVLNKVLSELSTL